MNKTVTLTAIAAGIAGSGLTYAFASKDTISGEGVTKNFEPNLNILNPILRISDEYRFKYDSAIKKSQELANRFKDEKGIPGMVVGVSVDGKIIWEQGFGFANLETRTPCCATTAMRIASISKPITMTLVAKLRESKKLRFDQSIYDLVPYFPRKEIDGEEVDITIRQLASHTAGVRHYKKKGEKKENEGRDSGREFYLKERFDTIQKSIDIFKDDELLFKPGTSFEYTTHGYTLLSAAIEKAGGKPFTDQIQSLFKVLGLHNTALDRVQKIIYGRASYYDKSKQGSIVNAELADTSYKWAGGGFISTVEDLIKFGNAMLYSYQQCDGDKPGFLKKETVTEIWTPVNHSVMKWGFNAGYGLGWIVVPPMKEIGGVNSVQKFYVGHGGGAVGASSVLLVIPKEIEITYDENNNKIKQEIPQGVTVAILVNLENIGCRDLGLKIADEFGKVSLN